MSEFGNQLDAAYQKKVVERLEQTVRKVAISVDAYLVAATPVDTGRARANWLASLNVAETRKVEPPRDYQQIDPVVAQYKIEDTILISNNLPYIRRLNDGWSKQAPAGFVEAAIAQGKRAVTR